MLFVTSVVVVQTQAKVLNVSSRYIEYVGYENVTSSNRRIMSLRTMSGIDLFAANISSSGSTSTTSVKFVSLTSHNMQVILQTCC